MTEINVDILSSKSVTIAIEQLKKYQERELKKKRSAFVKAVARIMEERIRKRYEEVDNVNAHRGISISSDGAMGIAYVDVAGYGLFFAEFGTGVFATTGKGWEYGFYPGSWSEKHERTFQKYMLSGRTEFADPDGNYIYNYEAADAFTRVIGQIEDILREAADEVFND